MGETRSMCSNQKWLDCAYDKLLVKMRAECARIGTKIPYTTDSDGTYHDVEDTWGLGFWTNGFWPGIYHDPTGENTEVPIIYADYYFIEAILRLKGKALFAW